MAVNLDEWREKIAHGETNSGCTISAWPVFWLVVLCAGDPDLLDAIIRLVGNY
jgi:hypothetical protein